MPVLTRSQSKLLKTEEDNSSLIRVYKLVNLINDITELIPVIAVLIIPQESKTTFKRKLHKNANENFAKYRADCVFVEDITDLKGDSIIEVKKAYSIFKPDGIIENTLVYTKGQFVYPDHFNSNINNICGGGIHFFKTIEAVCCYYIKGTNSKYDLFKIYPGISPIHYSFYKDALPNGIYNIYSGDGLWQEQVKYENNMLKEYNFILNHTQYSTKFTYCINSLTQNILVSAITFEMNKVGFIYKVISEVKKDNFPINLIC
jgi:hypothetical protein